MTCKDCIHYDVCKAYVDDETFPEVDGCSLAQSQYGRQTKGDIMNIQLDKQAKRR